MTDFGIEMNSGSSSITADTHRGWTRLSESMGVGSYVSPLGNHVLTCDIVLGNRELEPRAARKGGSGWEWMDGLGTHEEKWRVLKCRTWK